MKNTSPPGCASPRPGDGAGSGEGWIIVDKRVTHVFAAQELAEAARRKRIIPSEWYIARIAVPSPASDGSQPEAAKDAALAGMERAVNINDANYAAWMKANGYEWPAKSPAPSPAPMAGGELADLIRRLRQIADHDWRFSFLAHTSDTAAEATTALQRQDEAMKALERAADNERGTEMASTLLYEAVRKAISSLRSDKP